MPSSAICCAGTGAPCTARSTPPRGTWRRAWPRPVAAPQDRLGQFFGAFRVVFPPGGEYRHDQLHLRAELSDEQKAVEPRNGDSHLTFIGAGMRNCVTYRNRPPAPVYFIDLDGKYQGGSAAAAPPPSGLRPGGARGAGDHSRSRVAPPGRLHQPHRPAAEFSSRSPSCSRRTASRRAGSTSRSSPASGTPGSRSTSTRPC